MFNIVVVAIFVLRLTVLLSYIFWNIGIKCRFGVVLATRANVGIITVINTILHCCVKRFVAVVIDIATIATTF